jgi:hypothetical protein
MGHPPWTPPGVLARQADAMIRTHPSLHLRPICVIRTVPSLVLRVAVSRASSWLWALPLRPPRYWLEGTP